MESVNGPLQGEYTFLPLEKVYYGPGSLEHLPGEMKRLGHGRAFLVTGHSLAARTPLVKKVEDLLGASLVGTYSGIRQHAPESGIAEAARLARECQADLIVSLGGGSPIDAAKAVAQYLSEDGFPVPPHIAVPTTLSAAEFSGSAGFTRETPAAGEGTQSGPIKTKVGFSGFRLAPRAVILDPEMTLPTPMNLWLSSGIRALDHAVETLYSPGYHPVNDVLALQAIRDLFIYLPRSRSSPEDLVVRQACQQAAWMSYFGPAAVSSAAGMSHTIGKRIGATYDVPHGVTSCILLAHVMRFKAESPEDAARLAPAARALNLAAEGATDQEAALAAADAVSDLVRQLDLPSRLRDVNVPPADFERIARAAAADPGQVPAILGILRQAW